MGIQILNFHNVTRKLRCPMEDDNCSAHKANHGRERIGTLNAYMNTYVATLGVCVEGIFSGFIMAFILINFIETDKAD